MIALQNMQGNWHANGCHCGVALCKDETKACWQDINVHTNAACSENLQWLV